MADSHHSGLAESESNGYAGCKSSGLAESMPLEHSLLFENLKFLPLALKPTFHILLNPKQDMPESMSSGHSMYFENQNDIPCTSMYFEITVDIPCTFLGHITRI
jgi:hypothetical protein